MNAATTTADSEPAEYDSTFLHTRKEAVIIFSLWLVGLIWAVPFCYLNGYDSDFDPENFSTTFGIPTWLFWGIAVPWIVADIFTTWFCFCYMKDDDLGEANDDQSAVGDDGSKEVLT